MSTALGLSESATRQVVSAAGMAPSLFNTQPWRFRLCPDRIEVHADLGRRLIGHDPEDRELRIACGAALFNLRLALHAHGVTPVVTIEPGDLPDALAVVRRGPATVQSRDDAALYQAIKHRRTNRHPFLDAPMPEAYRRVLTYAAAAEGADLRTITTPAERFELRCIIAAADQRQRDDVVCRAELEAWTGDRHGHPDGVPLAAAGPETRTPGPVGVPGHGKRLRPGPVPGRGLRGRTVRRGPLHPDGRTRLPGPGRSGTATRAADRDRPRTHRVLPVPTHRGHRRATGTAPAAGRRAASAGRGAPGLRGTGGGHTTAGRGGPAAAPVGSAH